MDVPLEIRFHNMAPSDAIEARVRDRVEKLNHITPSPEVPGSLPEELTGSRLRCAKKTR